MCYSIKEDLYLLIKRKLVDWKAYCQSCDGSAYVYVKDKNDTDTIREVQLLLEELLQNKQNGIEFILHDEVAKDCGADGNCLFMLEAREGYYFTENYTGDFEITEKMLRLVKIYIWYAWILSTKPNYETIFIAAGKGIKVALPSRI